MDPFKTHRGLIAPLDRANIDTDAIIPKQFLKSIKRTGFGESLFFDWRYLPDGKPNPEFSLNASRYQGASILVARNNFGCGSSREHAVWAIQQFGFRAVIAPWQEHAGSRIPAFADIFRNNCGKNSLLAIELSPKEVDQIFKALEQNPGLEATIDLAAQILTLHTSKEISFHFEIDPSVKERLLNGLDDIGITMKHEKEIAAFEAKHHPQLFR